MSLSELPPHLQQTLQQAVSCLQLPFSPTTLLPARSAACPCLHLIAYDPDTLYFLVTSDPLVITTDADDASFTLSLSPPHTPIAVQSHFENLEHATTQYIYGNRDKRSPHTYTLRDVLQFVITYLTEARQKEEQKEKGDEHQKKRKTRYSDSVSQSSTSTQLQHQNTSQQQLIDLTTEDEEQDDDETLAIATSTANDDVVDWDDDAMDDDTTTDAVDADHHADDDSEENDDAWGDAEEYDPVTSTSSYQQELAADAVQLHGTRTTQPYAILLRSELPHRQQQLIQRLTSLLKVPAATAILLLRHCHWNEQTTIQRFQQDAGVTLPKEAGCATQLHTDLITPTGCSSSGSQSMECPICYDEVPMDQTFSLPCMHRACLSCYKLYVQNTVLTGTPGGANCLATRCIHPQCKELVNSTAMEFLCLPDTASSSTTTTTTTPSEAAASVSLYAKYRSTLERSFVDESDTMCWCPQAECKYVIVQHQPVKVVTLPVPTPPTPTRSSATISTPSVPAPAPPTVSLDASTRSHGIQCKCGHRFCLSCKQEDHAPATCQQALTWLARDTGSLNLDNRYLLQETKPCPSCGVRTKKDGGCQQIHCTQCQTSWCWHCGQSDHHVWECNKNPYSQHQADTDLNRYLFYFERYFNHHSSLSISTQQWTETQKKMQQLIANGMHWRRVNFLASAVSTVMECRRVLKWTYVYSYYLHDAYDRSNPQVTELFEYRQSELEKYTEKLNKLTAGNVDKLEADRLLVLNWTAALTSYVENMQNDNTLKRVIQTNTNSSSASSSTTGSSSSTSSPTSLVQSVTGIGKKMFGQMSRVAKQLNPYATRSNKSNKQAETVYETLDAEEQEEAEFLMEIQRQEAEAAALAAEKQVPEQHVAKTNAAAEPVEVLD